MQARAQVLFMLSTEHKQRGRLSVLRRHINYHPQSRGGSRTCPLCPTSSCTFTHTHTRCVVIDIHSLPILTSLTCCFLTLRFAFFIAPLLPHASRSAPLVLCLALCIGMPVSCSWQSEAVALSRYIIDAHSTLTNSRVPLRAQTQKRRPPAPIIKTYVHS